MRSKLLWVIATTLSILGVAPQASADLFELDMNGTVALGGGPGNPIAGLYPGSTLTMFIDTGRGTTSVDANGVTTVTGSSPPCFFLPSPCVQNTPIFDAFITILGLGPWGGPFAPTSTVVWQGTELTAASLISASYRT
jgi:hypothetical protein